MSTIERVAKAMLMVTQGNVDPDYAWRVQDQEVRDELLDQARVAVGVTLNDAVAYFESPESWAADTVYIALRDYADALDVVSVPGSEETNR